MIFSGTYYEKLCIDCGHKVARVGTTAIVFWVMLLGIGVAVVLPTVKSSSGGAWWHWLMTIAGELVLLAIVVLVVCVTSNWLRRIPTRCPRCGGEWQTGASGFYDFSLIPTIDDFLIALLFRVAQIPIVGWIAA